MNKLLSGVCVIGLVLGAATAVNAKSTVDSPKDRADRGIGCIVAESEEAASMGAYLEDPNCVSQVVNKRDKDGLLISQRYHDSGELQPGQVAPDRATSWSDTFIVGAFECSTVERVAPSGRYSSHQTCKRM